MFVQQFFVKGLAHSSYLLGGSETCAIVDPARDVQVYIDAAKAMGMRITHVLETHLHADFISGHLELAELTGAEIVAPRAGACDFACSLVGGGGHAPARGHDPHGAGHPGAHSGAHLLRGR